MEKMKAKAIDKARGGAAGFFREWPQAARAGAGVRPCCRACLAADPQPGGGHATQAQGAAAGGTSSEANSQLETCSETLGTIMIDEQTNAGWYSAYQSQYKMGSTVPALRLIIQQSNCFVIVDRGRGLAARSREADLIRGEEGRAGSNFGKGQIAAADFTMIPEVMLSDRGGTRAGGGLGGLLGRSGFGADDRRHRRLDVDQRSRRDPDPGRQPLDRAAGGGRGLLEERRLRRHGRPVRRWRRRPLPVPTPARRRARSSSRRSPTRTTRWSARCATTRRRRCAAAWAPAAGWACRAAAPTPRAK